MTSIFIIYATPALGLFGGLMIKTYQMTKEMRAEQKPEGRIRGARNHAIRLSALVSVLWPLTLVYVYAVRPLWRRIRP